MRGGEAFRNLLEDREGFIDGKRSVRQPLFERLAFDELHDQEEPLRFLEAVERRDVRMIERRDDLRLALETFLPLRVARESFGQDFDGDLALQLAVASAIDLTHAARSDGRKDLVVPQVTADFERHRAQINYHPQSGWFDEGPSKGPPPCGRGLKPPEVLLLLVFFLFLLVADVVPNNGLV